VLSPWRERGALTVATVRAYDGDLRGIRDWCLGRGIPPDLAGLDARRVFAHCVELSRAGRGASTIRRRLTALRAALGAGSALGVSAAELFEVQRRVLSVPPGGTSVLVLSEDPITRAGLRAVLTDSGALCWSDAVTDLDAATLSSWDYVLVWVAVPEGLDRYGAIGRFAGLDPGVTTAVPVVAVHPGPLHPLVRLRLAEAGFRYALGHDWLSTHLDEISALLMAAELPDRFHLETPLAIRQRLGLRLAGELAPVLDLALDLPREVWSSQRSQEQLAISRHDVRRLRRAARDVAGLPAPDFARYATAVRRAPDAPEWATVRATVRAALGLRAARA
jgi:hypothetical protein